MTQTIKTLGELSTLLLTSLAEQGRSIFTFEEAAATLGKKNGSLRQLLSSLVKKGWIRRLEKGKYLILPLESGLASRWTEHEFVIASHLIEPYYIDFWSALNFYGYTERIPPVVFVATTIKRKKAVEISGVAYRFVCLSRRKFFGWQTTTIFEQKVNIATKEKAVADCLDLPQYAGGVVEVAKALKYGEKEMDLVRVTEHAIRMGNGAILKRLGFLLDTLTLLTPALAHRIETNLTSGYALLDAPGSKVGRYDSKWKVLVNVNEDWLQE